MLEVSFNCGSNSMAFVAVRVLVLLLAVSTCGTLGVHAQDVAASKFSNVIDFGADPSGTKESTDAFGRSLRATGAVFIPCGKYRINWEITGSTNFIVVGAGSCTALYPAAVNRPVIKIQGTNFSEFRDFSVLGEADGSASGIVVILSHNTGFRNLHVSGFPRDGLECVGGEGAGSSGIQVTGGYYLANRKAGIEYENCQDFRITDSNIGKNEGYGISLRASNAGQVSGNYVWENGVAISGSSLGYNWFANNRITQSQKEGFVCVNCNFLTVTGNQSYENSRSETAQFEDWKFIAVNRLIFSDNLIFDWTGQSNTNYGLTVDEKSSDIIISDNIFANHVLGSMQINGAQRVTYSSNNGH